MRLIRLPGGNGIIGTSLIMWQSAGRNVLTIRILTEGNMNLAYFDFKPVR
jgi:hypothetical protein